MDNLLWPATLLGSSGLWISFSTPYRSEAAGSGPPSVHCHIAGSSGYWDPLAHRHTLGGWWAMAHF